MNRNRVMKRLAAVALSVSLAVPQTGICAYAQTGVEKDNFVTMSVEKNLLSDDESEENVEKGEYQNISYLYEKKTKILTLSGKGEITSAGPWSDWKDEVKKIEIEEGITGIGENTFQLFETLEKVSIPKSVTYIGDYAFSGCNNLETLWASGSLSEIGQSAFSQCTSLKSVFLSGGVKTIKELSFSACKSLEEVTLGRGTITLEERAFSGCTSLKNLTLPNGLKSIGYEVFNNCISLTNVKIPDEVMELGNSIFAGCKNLKTINIPKGVSSLGEEVFEGCSGLKKVTIPKQVIEIDNHAFDDSIDNMTIYGEPGSSAQKFASSWRRPFVTTKEDLVYRIEPKINSKVTLLGKTSGHKEKVKIPGKIKLGTQTFTVSIGKNAFKGEDIDYLTIGEGVKGIGEGAFSKCEFLKTVTIGKNVESIGKGAFSNCPWLTKVTMDKGVKTISSDAFRGSKSLYKITIKGNEIEKIGSNAFKGIKKNASVKVPKSGLKKYQKLFTSKTGFNSKTMKLTK